jgi:ABC-type protease/lipase transport system fused ATPase/permease subunit
LNDEILSNCPYVIRRTYWAEDAVGEYGTCSHLITVIDDIAPVLMNVPEDLVVECSAVSDDMSVPDVWAYDECSKSNVPVEVKVDVLQGIDLTVADGEVLVFVGPSGCCKSNLLRLVSHSNFLKGVKF